MGGDPYAQRMRVAVCQLNARDDRQAEPGRGRRPARPGGGGRRRPGGPAGVRRLSRPGGRAAEARAGRRRVRRVLRRGRPASSASGCTPGRSTRSARTPRHTYNTSLVFDRAGELAATYRKIHLYDVEIPGRVSYLESASGRARHGDRWWSTSTAYASACRSATTCASPSCTGSWPSPAGPGAGGAGRVHGAHRAGPLGGAAAGPGDREPVLRGGGRPDRRPRSRAHLLRPQHGDRPVGDRARPGAGHRRGGRAPISISNGCDTIRAELPSLANRRL